MAVKTIGSTIRAIRMRFKLTQRKVAAEMNIKEIQFSLLENDRFKTPKVTNIQKFCQAVKITMRDFNMERGIVRNCGPNNTHEVVKIMAL